MIVVCDINEIWRRKPFSALAEQTEVLGAAPADWFVVRLRQVPLPEGKLAVLPAVLPHGWASRTAWLGQRKTVFPPKVTWNDRVKHLFEILEAVERD